MTGVLRSGEANGTPLRYSCLENPMDGEAWWATVHGDAKSQTWLSNFTFTFHFHALEKEMATHSSILAWRIPGTEEPSGLLSIGSHRVRHDWSDLAAAAAAAAASVYISESKWLNQILQDPDIRFTSPPDSLHILSVHFFILHILDSVLNISHVFNFLYLISWVPWGTWEMLPFPAVL